MQNDRPAPAQIKPVPDLTADPLAALIPGAKVLFAASEPLPRWLRADMRYYVIVELPDGETVRLTFIGAAVSRLTPLATEMLDLLDLPNRPGFWRTEEVQARTGNAHALEASYDEEGNDEEVI